VKLGLDPTSAICTSVHAVVLRKLQQFVAGGHDVTCSSVTSRRASGDADRTHANAPAAHGRGDRREHADLRRASRKVLDMDG